MGRRAIVLLLLLSFATFSARAAEVRPLSKPGVANLFSIATNIYSGGAPEGDAGFRSLQELGIKTIITVDGTQPDAERAHSFGMRYIHLPHGYDGISTKVQAQLIKAAETADGPLYVHCHHGKHRGPAAAAVICMARNGWSPADGDNWLHIAGTDTNYAGLFQSVRNFRAPSAEALKQIPTTFAESQKPRDLVATMIELDATFDRLKLIAQSGFTTPRSHPDLVPQNETLILSEHFREAQRLPAAQRKGDDFTARLKNAENAARELRDRFESSSEPKSLQRALDAVATSCVACHGVYRDHTDVSSK